jgi:hypothetical protein
MRPVHAILSRNIRRFVMRHKLRFVLPFAVVLGLPIACDDDPAEPDEETFEATLTGAAERPDPVTTNAIGAATLTVRNGSVDFEITASNLIGVRLAHIHGPASQDVAAGILVTLLTPVAAPGFNVANGTVSEGSFPSAAFTLATGVSLDSVLVLMRNGQAYVNVHTVANGGGEIRGQISSSN